MKLLALLLLLGSALAQEPIAVSGKAQNALTGEPVRGFALTLRNLTGSYAAATTSSAEGNFAFTEVPEGSYFLLGEKAGYLQLPLGARTLNSPATVLDVKAAGIKDVVFKAIPQSVISGQVVDENGEPLEHVALQLAVKRRGKMTLARVAQTNDQGEFRFAGLTAGTYYVVANRPARQSGVITKDKTGFVTTYLPGTTDPAAALALELQSGMQISKQQITLRRGEVFTVRGRVQGEALPGRHITLIPQREADRAVFRSFGGDRYAVQADGTFALTGVSPGGYELVVSRYIGTAAILGRMPLTIAQADIEGLTLAIQPPMTVLGRVKFDGESKTPLGSLRVQMQASEAEALQIGSVVSKDGTFLLNDVSPTTFYLFPMEGTDAYVKRILLGGREVDGTGLNFAGQGGDIEILLGTKPAKLTGTIEHEEGSNGAGIAVLVPSDVDLTKADLLRATSYQAVVNVDIKGQFTYPALPPGKYKLLASEEYTVAQTIPADVLAKIGKKFIEVELVEGQALSVRVKQISRRELMEAGMDVEP